MVLLKHPKFCSTVAALLVTVVSTLHSYYGKEFLLTKNQIEFNKLVETKRSNKRQEELTEARDLYNREYQQASVANTREANAETARANRAREAYNVISLDEVSRHNVATELAQQAQLGEASRHNVATEGAAIKNLEEQMRSNLANEQLKERSQTEQERSNRESEALSRFRNAEQQRSNQAQESLSSEANFIRLNTLYEQQRANKARESYQLADLAQQLALKQRELEDRYFWQDKVNQLIGSLASDEIKGGIDDAVNIKIPEQLNRLGNKAETWWHTKGQKQAREASGQALGSAIDVALQIFRGIKLGRK